MSQQLTYRLVGGGTPSVKEVKNKDRQQETIIAST